MKNQLIPLTRRERLERIIWRLNDIHRARRLAGRTTAHLYSRSRKLTAAYLSTKS